VRVRAFELGAKRLLSLLTFDLPTHRNRAYPFNPGDLSACIIVASNFLNDAPKVPWDDLRYIFGEIMYGGHITDNFDRRLCGAYLLTYVREELLDGLAFFPKFEAPPPSLSHKQFMEYIDETLVNETPMAFGLHANAEINFMTQQAAALFSAAGELAPRGATGGGGMTLQEKVKRILDDITERLPDLFSMMELDERTQDERSPYTSVFLQECERMNMLIFEMKRSLAELDLGLKGDLSISEPMEKLMNSLYDDKVPANWHARAWPCLRPLASWLSDVLQRYRQLEAWTADLSTPKVTWLPGLFNPQAFLTAVMQVTARKNELPLDRLATVVEVSKKMNAEEIEAATRDGAYISGLFMEGARWDTNAGMLEEAILKQLYRSVLFPGCELAPILQQLSTLSSSSQALSIRRSTLASCLRAAPCPSSLSRPPCRRRPRGATSTRARATRRLRAAPSTASRREATCSRWASRRRLPPTSGSSRALPSSSTLSREGGSEGLTGCFVRV
jgi:dynein heavy chain